MRGGMMDIELEPSGKYRAHIAVEAPMGAPSTAKVKKALLDKTNGQLSDLNIYYEQAPADWPPEDREDKADIGMAGYWLEGTWAGAKGSIPQSTDVYQILWIRRLNEEPEKEEFKSTGSRYEWIPVAGAVALLGVALHAAFTAFGDRK